jgi:hypothetical protein
MMRKPSLQFHLMGSLAIALLFGACDGTVAGPGAFLTEMTPAEVDDLGTMFEDETDVSLGALVYGGTMNSADLSLGTLSTAASGGPPRPDIDCVIIEPLPPEDPDHDGVPTRLSVHFDPEPCVIRGSREAAFFFTGSLGISDPAPETPGYDSDESYEAFGHGVEFASGLSFMTVRTGTRSVRQEGNALGASEAFQSVHVANGEREKHTATEWGLRFTGDSTIVIGAPVPSGSLMIEGVWATSSDRGNRVFHISTVTPLQYDASCIDARPIHRFTAGEIHKVLMVNEREHGTIVVTWVGCGQRPVKEYFPSGDGETDGDRPHDGLRDGPDAG